MVHTAAKVSVSVYFLNGTSAQEGYLKSKVKE